MEPFEINLAGDVLTVQPNENESFTIFLEGTRLCDLWPDTDLEDAVIWSSLDPVSPTFVKQVGELIEEHEM